MKQILFVGLLLTAMLAMSEDHALETKAVPVKRVVLVVQNHCMPVTALPMSALADALTANLSKRGFQVVNPHNVIGTSQNITAAGEKMPEVSATELARELSADGMITASVIELLDTTIGTPVSAHQFVIRLAFNLADAKGATICGETLKVKSRKYTPNQMQANKLAYLGDLMYDAAATCAENLVTSAGSWRPVPLPPPAVVQPVEDPLKVTIGSSASIKPVKDRSANKKPIPPTTGDLALADLDGAVTELIRAMLGSSQFLRNYASTTNRIAEGGSGKLPLAVIGGIADFTRDERIAALVASLQSSVRVVLFKTKWFDVKDDDAVSALVKRILAAGNSPLEDGELMSALKRHGSPDFLVAGDLKFFRTVEKKSYRLRLAIHDLTTGKVAWEGVKDIEK